ncbi:MAG: MFS transporter, partial [Chloroflexi bacterium]|nr:MFS transporter [Chloroflexota bacterium]
MFYGWVMVAASFVNQLLNSGLGFLGFGTYVVPLQQGFGWSKASIAAARSLMQMENGLLGPLQGVLIDRFGPRLVMAVGSFFFGLGLILLSLIHSLWVFYGVFLVIALGTSLAGFLTTTVAVNSWFARRRTTAMALAGLGVSFGGIVVLPLLIAAQTTYGWRFAALVSGLTVWTLGLPASLLMRRSPEKYGALPDGDLVEASTPATIPENLRHEGRLSGDFTLGEALHTSAFWFISA